MKPPIAIFIGDDPYLVEKERDRHFEPALFQDAFGSTRFRGGQDTLGLVLDSCFSIPLGSDWRFVALDGIENLKKNELEELGVFFQKPPPHSTLVMMGSKIDKRVKVFALASQKGWITEVKAPYSRVLPQWVASEAKQKALAISDEAALQMADWVGPQFRSLSLLLDQLGLYISPRKKIELRDLEELAGRFTARSVFEFTDAVGRKNFIKAQAILDEMEREGEPPVRLNHMMVRHFRLLILASLGLRLKWNEKEMAQKMGVSPFFLKDYLTQAKVMKPSQLRAIYRLLLKTDRDLKSSPLGSRVVLDRFLIDTLTA